MIESFEDVTVIADTLINRQQIEQVFIAKDMKKWFCFSFLFLYLNNYFTIFL